MRFMLLVRANRDSEAGVMPSQELIEAMFKFNEQMANAGVMLAAEGLRSSATGARISYSGSKRSVVEGPFDADELIAGYWMINVGSKRPSTGPNALHSSMASLKSAKSSKWMILVRP